MLNISGPEKLMNISLQEDDKYGYLGYSLDILRTPEGTFYVAGAPRYQYVGLVTVFRETPDGAEWIRNISGEQVGSYFGSEIEVCDIDQDDLSDVVLIAAPHFYDVRWSGQVSVYRCIQGGLQFQWSLHGESGHLHSQFGAVVSALGDLNGDGFSDVAVGAPYEMEGRGALYIYGGGAGGVNAEYSQRLTAPTQSSGFGLSVHGVLDMTRDGLTDVAVGAAGSVTLFRSQPLLNVSVTMTSIPPEIPIPTVESAICGIEVILEICVDPQIQTTQFTGPLNVSLPVLGNSGFWALCQPNVLPKQSEGEDRDHCSWSGSACVLESQHFPSGLFSGGQLFCVGVSYGLSGPKCLSLASLSIQQSHSQHPDSLPVLWQWRKL
ncbi:unnamed protein product [Staurois parvus]|uniref:Integrin alpha-2 domain-containing protein n=1 Tax=Staurois parvus TaxID=386267 RepID=A0ABN9H9T4_9NEOB|nr:unnamed protein product [Staurois parvus]